ncbi:uncharacterized protein JCM15063_000542 [Sporobolomyces koalae]|uniref:uncharacterized protein n=1 Tax=Sporobolomyces koalae TaxID=500713 RepID=UPI00317D40BE
MNVYSPRGTCREFYLTGSCARFGTPGGCRFRHDKSGESRATTSFSPFGALLPLSRAQPATPASPQELASAAKGVKSDALSPVVPSLRVDRSILFKVANDPDFKFHEPYQVYPWLNSLYASTQVKALLSTHEESQNVLAALANAEGPGMARLIEFLNFPQGIQVGGSPSADKLSFQRGFMAFVFWLTSGEIRGSVLTHHLNRIYHVLHIHAPAWAASTSTCLDSLMRAQTVKDPRLFGRSAGFAPANFLQIFGPLAQVLHEYLSRFRDAVVKNPSVQSLVTTLSTNFRIYAEAISNGSTEYDSSSFADARQHRFLIAGVRQSINTLLEIIDRIQVVPFVASVPTSITTSIPSLAALAALKRLFEPPGELRVGGPRHDNDKANIREIQILPTHAELLCPLPAFVPSNLPDGPSHLPVGSIDRQLDIVFRLLREDFVGPLRAAVSSIFADLQTLDDPSNALGALIKRGGGRYRPSSSAHADTSDLKVYAAVEFVGIRLSQQHELQLDLKLDFPEAFARSKVVRHLPSGSLVGLICRRTSSRAERANGANTHGPIDLGDATIFLGLVTEEARSSGPSRRSVGISFFEGGLYLEALRQLEAQRKGDTEHGEMICFEVPGFLLGTLKPFLQALQTIEPATLPFAKYLSALPPLPNSSIAIDPPLFARAPDFAYDLSSCLSAETPPGTLLLNIQDQDSIDSVRQTLTESSRLDPSQVGALIDCLSREVALVRGPPGTGKSWLGVELIRTLLASKVGKVLVLSYTNHALDTMLKHLMEQVTKEIIRAGSRSKDPAMADFNLNNRAFEQSRHLGRISHEVKELWTRRTELQKAIAAVCELATRVARQQIHFDHLERYLGISYPHHLASLCVVPFSLVSAHEQLFDEGWQIATSSRDAPSSTQLPTHPAAIFAWWRDGGDIALEEKAQLERDTAAKAFEDHLQQFAQQTKSRYDLLPIEESDSDSGDASISDSGSNATLDWFNDAHSELTENEEGSQNESEEEHEEQRYEPPCGDRSIAELANDHDVWKYSRAERDRVLEAWAEDLVRREGPHLDNLRHQQDEVNLRLKALNNDAKLRVLQDADIIGATTNSASNLLEIVAAAKPAVLVVEEAGECLEAQVIANLVPSIQHLIMIGDEKQLRPQISSYHLSTDSSQGSAHRHDVSLFERLALLPLPVSMLKTQRRMRPEISCLIRNFLYPELEDAPSVREYPNVKGMRENVFFIDHRLPEDAQAVDHSSKSNTQEATFVVDLVRHLLYQGYGGRIAVICPYLGQVAALKRELERETISVAIDDRDAEDLAAAREVEEHSQEEGASEEESALKPAQAAMRTPKSQVDLRTIDRFQGEEADIVILSLVRNSASPFEEEEGQRFYSLDRAAKSGIGFLKSSNRTNVAISRARHGMYLFGDAQLLSEKSKMWKSIVAQLDEQDAIAPHLPARCDHHPDKSLEIDRPGKLQQLSPNGGCLERCEAMLTCGHECARICHADDPECANDDRKAQVVDYILLSTLGEFDEADQDPANRLMTIDCGHSLSVATLDGLFEFDIFYRKDEKGCVIGLAHPQTSDKEVVRCPTCKTPITSRSVKRYGRSLKHREATVQERLWTIRGQAIIKDAADFVDSLPISQINDRVTKFRVSCLGKASSSAREAKENQRRFLKSFAADFVLPDIFRDRRITGLSKPLSSFWTGATSPLLKALCKLDEVGSRKSPYSKAYDAAVSQLFYEEKERLSTTPNLIRDIDEGALEFALSAAGVARPTTDLKLLLQHVWLSLEVRSSLAKITARLACIVHTHESSSVQTDHQSLLNMASFIFKTSIRDVDMTISLAHERRCGRLKMEGQLRRLQVLLAQNSFFARSRVEYKVAPRNAVHDFAEDTRRNSLLAFDRAVVEFCEEQPLQRGWLDEQILPGRDKIAEQWKSLLQEVQGHFYQQVTDEELKLVIQSQEFATSSHWYICPNGHTYTIGDCGGAVMQAQCPECGATIGGAGHRVAEGNHHDERMIRLTRESTDARHEFPWGRQ